MELLAAAGAVFLFFWSNWKTISRWSGRLWRLVLWYRAQEVEPSEGQIWSSFRENDWAEILDTSESGVKIKSSEEETFLTWSEWEEQVTKNRAYQSRELTIEDRYWGRETEKDEES